MATPCYLDIGRGVVGGGELFVIRENEMTDYLVAGILSALVYAILTVILGGRVELKWMGVSVAIAWVVVSIGYLATSGG
jgi:hypothetical protein